MSKVYIKVDSENRIIGLDGGYTESNIHDPENWIFIDEGEGDRYNLCQCHYLPEPILNDDCVSVYKYINNEVIHRTPEEIAADTPEPVPSEYEDMKSALEILEVKQ